MQIQIGKWGNSLAFRLPSKIASELELRDGSFADLSLENNNIVISPAVHKYSLDELVSGIKESDYYGETNFGGDIAAERID